jgi:hypothetical protein
MGQQNALPAPRRWAARPSAISPLAQRAALTLLLLCRARAAMRLARGLLLLLLPPFKPCSGVDGTPAVGGAGGSSSWKLHVGSCAMC